MFEAGSAQGFPLPSGQEDNEDVPMSEEKRGDDEDDVDDEDDEGDDDEADDDVMVKTTTTMVREATGILRWRSGYRTELRMTQLTARPISLTTIMSER